MRTSLSRFMQFCTVLVMAGIAFAAWWYWPVSGDEANESETIATSSDSDTVVLAEGKLESVQLKFEQVEYRSVRVPTTVPGRLSYDETKHNAILSPASGVLVSIRVHPGDEVQAGDVIAEVNSPEVGAARADVLKASSAVEVSERQANWDSEVHATLATLLKRIQQNATIDEIETEFDGRALGHYRQQLISAYSQLTYTEQVADGTRTLQATGAIPARTVRERLNARRQAEAEFEAICEQVAFDSSVAKERSFNQLADARRRLKIASQELQVILGCWESESETAAVKMLSALSIVAPFAGTIESVSFANSERVNQGSELCILADARRLWVVADVRERDWPAAAQMKSERMQVRIPTFPDRSFEAEFLFLGRSVDPVSQSVQLIASIDNTFGDLRPGMFARTTLESTDSDQWLTVSSRSIVQHENKSFVFVVDGPQQFRSVDVEVGRKTEEWTEVRSGLEQGETVVAEGAFVLKSELLLMGEE